MGKGIQLLPSASTQNREQQNKKEKGNLARFSSTSISQDLSYQQYFVFRPQYVSTIMTQILIGSISGTTLGSKGPGQVSQYQAGLTLVGAGSSGTNPPMHNPTIGGINAANKFNTISNVHKRGGGGGVGWNRSLLEEQVRTDFPKSDLTC